MHLTIANTAALVGLLIGLTVLGGIIYRALKKAVVLDQSLPVLTEIAREFSNNGGSSLRDQIDGIRKEQKQVAASLVESKDDMQAWLVEHERLDAERFEVIADAATKAGWDLAPFPRPQKPRRNT